MYWVCVCVWWKGVHLLQPAFVETRGKPLVLSSVSLYLNLLFLKKALSLTLSAPFLLYFLDSQLLKSTRFLPTLMLHSAWVLCKCRIQIQVFNIAQQTHYPPPKSIP